MLVAPTTDSARPDDHYGVLPCTQATRTFLLTKPRPHDHQVRSKALVSSTTSQALVSVKCYLSQYTSSSSSLQSSSLQADSSDTIAPALPCDVSLPSPWRTHPQALTARPPPANRTLPRDVRRRRARVLRDALQAARRPSKVAIINFGIATVHAVHVFAPPTHDSRTRLRKTRRGRAVSLTPLDSPSRAPTADDTAYVLHPSPPFAELPALSSATSCA
ncbi:hypothetical protein GGX14DRAFT_619257 [Mycena pura]|uniref:Uncharacterized protein n=1 Tax=Mycena pura TaxID=153505 RepID=A0AAD6VJB7_9AGAR|nr:hypothetical protein GGX14DRAFT_619257 [Mycena pura]